MTAELVRRYQRAYNATRMEAARRVEELWRRVGGLSDDDAEAFLRASLPVVEGAQRAVAALVDGYLAVMARQYVGSAASGTLDFDAIRNARGIPPAAVYERPVVTARTAVSQGVPVAEAMVRARRRAGELARTDVMLAQRSAAVQVLSRDDRVVGYRRTLTGDSCALCATASTQRYRSNQLAPIHAKCDCGVAPIYGTADPGQVVNRRLLSDLRGASDRPDYWRDHAYGVDEAGTIRRRRDVPYTDADGVKRTRTELGEPLRPAVREHGELGPVLTDPAHDFTGPGDIAA